MRIIDSIALYCASEKAAIRISSLYFYTSPDELDLELERVAEALKALSSYGNIPLYGYKEADEYILHAQKGGIIRHLGLITIASSIKAASQTKNYIEGEQTEGDLPLLSDLAAGIANLRRLADSIDEKIISETEVADNASSELYSIRRKMRQASSQIKEKLASITSSAETKKYLQDSIVTMRQGRYVVPVKSEHKANVDGIIHDSSSSGQTYFIEPQAVVSLNNRLRELEGEEAREIDRILASLSGQVGESAAELLENERIIIELDRLFAKAAYAYDSRHTRPVILHTEKAVRLRNAFHPLIGYEKAVKSDIMLGNGYRQAVITGPNTGGKTVLLKTLGVSCLMAAAGLFIPAEEGSALCLFSAIYTDIGDEQSIEQSLSTFSSHMTQIIRILDKVDAQSLVLLDEVGAGTDPSEGAALARAILAAILESGALCLATTHYSEIKRYALLTDGAINASMEFDSVRLEPTYRLHMGVPGKSNAFEISERLGLSAEILSKASEAMSSDAKEFESVIAVLEEKLYQASEALKQAQDDRTQAARTRDELQSDLRRFKSIRDKSLQEASAEARSIIVSSRNVAKSIIAEAEKFQAESRSQYSLSSQPAKEAISAASSAALNDLAQHLAVGSPPAQLIGDAPKSVTKGQPVFIPSLNSLATVLEPGESDALVQVGAMKARIQLSQMAVSLAKDENLGVSAFTETKSQHASSKLDIRGITANEAEIELDKFLDDASLAGIKTVTIIHGKGTGILRKAVDGILKEHPAVDEFRIGGLSEGGEGATIATLN
ncbi:MAG: endonuclease MutS2 [Eubacteriaceae bacterium]|nr:endonuclease MutS2 [Eubacteriaceae bacterium]